MKFYLILLVFLVFLSSFYLLGYLIYKRYFLRPKNPDKILLDTQGKQRKNYGDAIVDSMIKAASRLESMDCEAVETESFDHLKLRGKYFANPAPCGKTIILLHGYRSTGALDFGAQVPYLLSLGCNLLLVDERSHGESQGDHCTLGVAERFDAIAWSDWVAERSGPQEGVIYYGCSMGATAALLATAEDELSDNVIGVIADSAYIGPWLQLNDKLKKRGIPLNPTMNIVDILCMTKGRFSIQNCTTTNAMPDCQVPVLLIHGDQDHVVSWDESKINAEQCAAPSTFVKIFGAGHCLSYLTDPKRYEEAVTSFLKTLVGPPSPYRRATEESSIEEGETESAESDNEFSESDDADKENE